MSTTKGKPIIKMVKIFIFTTNYRMSFHSLVAVVVVVAGVFTNIKNNNKRSGKNTPFTPRPTTTTTESSEKRFEEKEMLFILHTHTHICKLIYRRCKDKFNN